MKLFPFTLIALFIGTIVHSQSSVPTKELDKKLNELLKASNTPGFSIAIVRGDQVIYSKGFGYSDLETQQKVDNNTLFAIGSTSKAFTTALLGIMEEEHDLSFDDSPRKYLPELEFFNDLLNTELTIKDLVCHRSGMPRHDYSWYLFPTESKDSLLARVKYQEPFADLRTQWYYNNFGYLIQGMITAKITGKSWEDNIRERYFIPLDMKRSNLTIAELQQQSNIAKGYEWANLETTKPLDYFNIAAISPAGSINSSAAEMSNWLKVWLNNGKYNGKQVLPESYIKKAINPLFLVGSGIADPAFPDQHLNSYGYAWFVSSYKGHYRLEHGGNIDGFTANVSLFPSDSLGIVILCNQDGSLLPSLARNAVSDILLNVKATDWVKYLNEKIGLAKILLATAKSGSEESRVKGTTPTHSLEEFQGNYTHPAYGTVKLVVENDSLFAKFPVKKFYLEHWHYDVFNPLEVKNRAIDTSTAQGLLFHFSMNDQGEIASLKLKLEPTLDAMEFERTPFSAQVDVSKLNDYVGEYELSGMKIKISLDGKSGLLMDVPGQPQYTLIPISDSEFTLKGIPGYKARFGINKDKVIELHMVQPNGTFTAKKVSK